MKPSYSVKINNIELDTSSKRRLKSLTITDEVGFISDQCQLTFSDDGSLDVPISGSEIIVAIGYGELSEMGRYTLDDASLSEGNLGFSAKGFDSTKGIKSIRSRDFNTKSIYKAVELIAAENNLKPFVSDDFKSLETEKKIIQQKESSLHVLRRLAESFDAIVKVQGGRLLFSKKNSGKSVSGKELETIKIDKSLVSTWSLKYSGRARFKSVSAQYVDVDTGKAQTIKAGEGQPTLNLRKVFNDRAKAELEVNSRFKEAGYETKSLSLSLPGNENLKAETIIELSGFRDGVNGKWLIYRATHTLASAYTTNLELKKDIR
ncbi:MAG: phage late control D family protein [Oligoflexales bacterium]